MGFGLSSRFFSISLSLLVGSERRLVMVLIEASAKPTWFRSGPRLVPFIFGRTRPASSYPAEREALNHHALVRQGGGPRRQVQIFATALKPEPGAAHCHLGAVRKRRWSLSSSSRLFWALRSLLWAARGQAAAFSVRPAARRWEPRRSQPDATARSRVCA